MFVKREILYLSFENKGYVSSVRVCVCIYEALISMTITRINRKRPSFWSETARNDHTREICARCKRAVTRGHVVCFFFYTNF